ncbi:hypothetical protein TAMA11512_03350 [Selenomonas sp. TAMA-11512]|uniref:DUF896 domain-containing protein n=1 Tax=Selenomonas sp. TAMA-11512 TaxID=3095337 RepID=UPI00308575C8|nr:hypothetical protein TAMA11512_03350 [Selenomonas sp. TAMA-11512]
MAKAIDYKNDYPALIGRINTLARKKREAGLSPEEQREQKDLYSIYLSGIRRQMTDMLDSIEVVDESPDEAQSRTDKEGKPRIATLH